MLQKKITNSKEFISKAKDLHGDKYDYSKVNYVNCSTKVCIICPKHGDFWTNPNNFIYRKTECPECAKEQQKARQSMTTKEFVEKAKKVHGDRYDYSKVEYNGVHKQILLHCNKCGKNFWQNITMHIEGHGCPKCNYSHLENEISTLLKENHIELEEQKRFDWLGKQSLDFYIPSKKIAIECQGEQHYQSVKIFGGLKKFIKQKKLDIQKKKLCSENHIKIIYFTHFQNAIDNQSTFGKKEKMFENIVI